MYLDLIKSNWHSDRSEIPQNRAIYNISQYLYNSLYVYILGYIQLLHSFFLATVITATLFLRLEANFNTRILV